MGLLLLSGAGIFLLAPDATGLPVFAGLAEGLSPHLADYRRLRV